MNPNLNFKKIDHFKFHFENALLEDKHLFVGGCFTFVNSLRRKLPPIHPFVLELVAVDVIALVPPRFPLLLLLKPGGGPRAPVLFGALQSSD